MSDCPYCKMELNHLQTREIQAHYYDVELEDDDALSYEVNEQDSINGVCQNQEFFCPYCESLLFTKEKEAVKFLKGEVKQDDL